MPKDAVEIWLLLKDVRKFISQAGQAAHAVTDIGSAAEKSGKKAGIGWKGMARWAGAAGLLYGATRFAKKAVSTTVDLAKNTLQLTRVTGMDTQTASAWVSVLKQRHVEMSTFNRTMSSLAKQTEKARLGAITHSRTIKQLGREYEAWSNIGGKQAPAALKRISNQMDAANKKGKASRAVFEQLGVPLRVLMKGQTQELFFRIADSFKNMQNPLTRAALAQRLFGRSWQQLLPLFMSGREGVQDALDMQMKYGNYLRTKSVDEVRKIVHAQKEWKAAQQGIQVQLGTIILPLLVKVIEHLVKFVEAIQPILRQRKLLVALLGTIASLWIAYSVATGIATIAQTLFNIELGITVGIIFGVVLALIAIGVGLYILYRHWDKVWGWIKKIALDAWNWIKNAALVAWNAIKNAASVAWQWIKQQAMTVWNFFKQLVTWLMQTFKRVLGIVLTPWKLELKLIIGAVKLLISWFKRLLDIAKKLTGPLGKAWGFAKHAGGGALGWAGKHFATGGRMPSTGNALVGERGPEIVTLPQGATVTPLPSPGSFAAAGVFTHATIPVSVVLDRRVVAQAVAQYGADKLARR